jgi:hypothetical protein
MPTLYQVMAHHIRIPDYGPEAAIDLPVGWQAVATVVRQGEDVVLLLTREKPTLDLPNAPVLTSLTPGSAPVGSSPVTVDVAGSNFDSTCVVEVDGGPRDTFLLSNTHLQYTARPDLETAPGTAQVTVVGDTGTSAALPFTYT